MKTLFSCIALLIGCFVLPLTSRAYSDYASCIGNNNCSIAAGGVVAVITIYTNQATGQSTVLPVRVKMFDEVMGNWQWWAITNGVFGTNVMVLPFQDVTVPQGYMLYWPEHHSTPGYPIYYSTAYPIFIESSDGGPWTNEFYFVLQGKFTKSEYYGPTPCTRCDEWGMIDATLYDGYNPESGTNYLMTRLGLGGSNVGIGDDSGTCETVCTNNFRRSSVAFVYFNLRPKPESCPGLTCPWSDILQEPFLEGWSGFSTNIVWDESLRSGFILIGAPNTDYTANWRYPNSPCDSNPLKQFRIRFDGDACCAEAPCASGLKLLISRISTNRLNLTFPMESGYAYQILVKKTPTDLMWVPWSPIVEGTGTITFRDYPTLPSRMYRLGRTTN